MSIGQRIRDKRKEYGLSQQSLADKLLIKRESVSLWESGVNTPTFDNLMKLESILKLGVLTEEFSKEVSEK